MRRATRTSLAAMGALGLVALSGSVTQAQQEPVNGLNRPQTVTAGPQTDEAKAALASFEQQTRLGVYSNRAAADPVVGGGFVSSPNVKYIATVPQTTDGVGARVVGNRLFVTSTKDLQVFDITDPTVPNKLGSISLNVQFENEQVPTDGKILGISGQTPTVNTQGVCPGDVDLGCVALFDVSANGAPVLLQTVQGVGDHTQTCVDYEGKTCAFMFGSSGNVLDLRPLSATPALPAVKAAFNWQTYLRSTLSLPIASGHHQTQIRPGVLMTSSIPAYLISINAADGGSPAAPKVLGKADFQGAPDTKTRFTHSSEWARGGTDKILLQGGETNFQPRCGATNGAFSTFTVTGDPLKAPTFTYADQYRLKEGNFLDGNPPVGSYALGCSVHWFEPRQDFKDGGVVALAGYENGTKFLNVDPAGKISEIGFFLGLRGSASAPHWAPDGKTVYVVDYVRGLDIIQFSDTAIAPEPVVPEFRYVAVLGVLGLLLAMVVVRRASRRSGALAV